MLDIDNTNYEAKETTGYVAPPPVGDYLLKVISMNQDSSRPDSLNRSFPIVKVDLEVAEGEHHGKQFTVDLLVGYQGNDAEKSAKTRKIATDTIRHIYTVTTGAKPSGYQLDETKTYGVPFRAYFDYKLETVEKDGNTYENAKYLSLKQFRNANGVSLADIANGNAATVAQQQSGATQQSATNFTPTWG